MYDVGDTVGLSVTVRNSAGTPTNATTVTLTITQPDGTNAAGITVTNPPAATGVYTYDYIPTQVGRHNVYWQTTSPATAFADVFDIRAANPGYIVSMADAKAHLNMTASGDDEELRGFIEATTEVVEEYRGEAIARRTFVEVHNPNVVLALHRPPVISLTSLVAILDGGTSYTPADLDVDTAAGIVRQKSGQPFAGPLRVTYVAGRSTVPARYVQAAKIIIGHLWQTQRGPNTGSARFVGTENEASFAAGLGFSIPYRAIELLGERSPGSAVA